MNINLREQLYLYQSQALSAFLGNILGAGILVYMIYPATNTLYALIWLGAQVVFNLSRFLLARHCSRITLDSDLIIERRARYYYYMIISSGLLWGSGSLLYPAQSLEHQLIFVMIIGAGSAAAIPLLNTMPRFAETWMTLCILPLFLVTLIHQDELSHRLSFMLVVLYLYLISTSRTFRDNLLESIELRIKLQHQATQDALTGIANRRYFMEQLQTEWHRASRHQLPITLMLLDLDHFKKLNDTYGHQKGDECLQTVAQLLNNNIRRSGEFVARIGGEEFAIVLPNATNGVKLAEKIQAKLAATHFTGNQGNFSVTVSIGMACTTPALGVSQQELFQLADDALYQAKQNGRNRYEISEINCNDLPEITTTNPAV